MKRYFTAILSLLLAAQIASAIPAKPGKFTRILPDGRRVTLELHGDEYMHWMTDESGRVVKIDAAGNLVPSSMAEVQVSMGGSVEANRVRMQRIEKTRQLMRRAAPTRSSDGALHFPMILVQFPNLQYKVGETEEAVLAAFNALANEHGYGGIGSIHDYYMDNTLNQQEFYFDVYGPVTVSQDYEYYGTKKQSVHGNNPSEPVPEALIEALRKVQTDSGNDHVFDPYDNDGDGYVDAVFMFYAGHNEAEGAPTATIWPHEWNLYSWDYYFDTNFHNEKFGNVKFNVYSCSSELKGNSGVNMCGIGTAVHEFGHALGLPDFYDTNYNNVGDGQCGGLYEYSPMCSGSYNNDGRTPAYFTMEERVMMGWAEGFTQMPASGAITIPSVDTNFAYKEETGVEGEYFIFECRKGDGWDAAVAPGLIVYHVDKSSNPVTIYPSGQAVSTTAGDLWESYRQYLNTNAEHPCYYIIPSADQDNVNYYGSSAGLAFPGQASVTNYRWQGWAADNQQPDLFYGISFNSSTGCVTLNREGVHTGVCGFVTDTAGEPVAGAVVNVYTVYSPATVTGPEGPSASAPRKIARWEGTPVATAETDLDGYYSVDLEGLDLDAVTMEVVVPYYLVKTASVTIRARAVVRQDFMVLAVEQPTYDALKKFTDMSNVRWLGFGDPNSLDMGAVSFSAGELADYVGLKIAGLEFYYNLDGSVSGVYGVIDFGEELVLIKEIPSPENQTWVYLDVSDDNLRIPAGKECHFGYALVDCEDAYPFAFSNEESVSGGMCLYHSKETSVPSIVDWWDAGRGPLLISVILEDGTVLQYNFISNPSAGTYSVGSTLNLDLIQVSGDRAPGSDIAWYFDDEPVSGTVTLSKAGKHTLEARFTTVAGKRKVVELEVTVQ